MRRLLVKGSLMAPLLAGMAVLGFGSTRGDFQLPGREVNSIEASTIKGGVCGGYDNPDCTTCTGKYAALSTGGTLTVQTGGGCSSTCTANTASTACTGS